MVRNHQNPPKSTIVRFGFRHRLRSHVYLEGCFGGFFFIRNSRLKRHRFPPNVDTISLYVSETIISKKNSKVDRALTKLKNGSEQPFVILRGFSVVPFNYPSSPDAYARKERGIAAKPPDKDQPQSEPLSKLESAKRRIDSLTGGILWALNSRADYRTPYGVGSLARNMVSPCQQQELPDETLSNVPLRFHTSVTQLPLPYEIDGGEVPPTCSYVSYVCINNWSKMPIYLLPINFVIECIAEEDRARVTQDLCQLQYRKLGPRADLATEVAEFGSHSILMKDPLRPTQPDAFVVSYDPARVWPDEDTLVPSFLTFRRAVKLASERYAYKVMPRRNDILLVDNLRCLVGRFEKDGVTFRRSLLKKITPNHESWWLRQHCGFPRANLEE